MMLHRTSSITFDVDVGHDHIAEAPSEVTRHSQLMHNIIIYNHSLYIYGRHRFSHGCMILLDDIHVSEFVV